MNSLWALLSGQTKLSAMQAQQAFISAQHQSDMNQFLHQRGVMNALGSIGPQETEHEVFLNKGKLSPEWHRAAFKEYERQSINRTYGDLFPSQVRAP